MTKLIKDTNTINYEYIHDSDPLFVRMSNRNNCVNRNNYVFTWNPTTNVWVDETTFANTININLVEVFNDKIIEYILNYWDKEYILEYGDYIYQKVDELCVEIVANFDSNQYIADMTRQTGEIVDNYCFVNEEGNMCTYEQAMESLDFNEYYNLIETILERK